MQESGASSHDDIRRYNLGRILRHLHLHGTSTRSELGTATRLNRSTVADLVATLASLGLVVEETGHRGSVGRPSLVVAPVPHAASVVAYRVDVDGITATLIGLGGVELARAVDDTFPEDPDAAIESMATLAADLLEQVDGVAIVIGVGVSVPATIDIARRTVVSAPNLGWSDVSLIEPLADALDEVLGFRPDVRVGNDANLGAVAEHLRGIAVGVSHLVYLLGRIGVGAGVIVDDRLDAGAHGLAGEIGHMVVDPNGRECSCGKRGCWETIIGRDAVIAAAGRHPGEATLTEILSDDREPARQAVATAVDSLAHGIRLLSALLDPGLIVLSGHLADLLPLLPAELVAPAAGPRCIAAALGADGALAGAAEIAFAELLADPTGAGRVPNTLEI